MDSGRSSGAAVFQSSYAWESVSEEQKGMFCIFNEQFVQSEEKNGSLANTLLFKLTGDKVFFLDESQLIFELVNK